MNVEGVVFDLDATLINLGGFVDWRKVHIMAKEEYLACGCPEEMINRLGETVLFNMLNMVREENALTLDNNRVERIQEEAHETIETSEWEGALNCHLMPGCTSTLSWLKDLGILMGVATSNSQDVAEWVLDSKKIPGYFFSVVGRRPEHRMKPHPDQILKCLEEKWGWNRVGVWSSATASRTSRLRNPPTSLLSRSHHISRDIKPLRKLALT